MPFRKLWAYACQIEILENLFCLVLTLNVEIVLPLDALRRQMPSTMLLIYSIVNMIGYYLIFLLHISEILSRSCATKITC